MGEFEIRGAPSEMHQVFGTLSPVESLRGTLSHVSEGLSGTLTIPARLDSYPEYDGAVEITPDAHEDIVLNTADTTLKSDITVFKIPTYETSNEFGMTFIIGG